MTYNMYFKYITGYTIYIFKKIDVTLKKVYSGNNYKVIKNIANNAAPINNIIHVSDSIEYDNIAILELYNTYGIFKCHKKLDKYELVNFERPILLTHRFKIESQHIIGWHFIYTATSRFYKEHIFKLFTNCYLVHIVYIKNNYINRIIAVVCDKVVDKLNYKYKGNISTAISRYMEYYNS